MVSNEAIAFLREALKHIDSRRVDMYRWDKSGEVARTNRRLANELIEAGFAREGWIVTSIIPTEEGRAFLAKDGG